MNVFKKAIVMLALAVGSLFVGLGSADAQWGYRRGYYGGYYGGYAPRYYGGYRPYYARPYYGYRSYYARPYYGGYRYRPYGYYGGSGVYVGQGGIGIRF